MIKNALFVQSLKPIVMIKNWFSTRIFCPSCGAIFALTFPMKYPTKSQREDSGSGIMLKICVPSWYLTCEEADQTIVPAAL